MSLFSRRSVQGPTAAELIPPRPAQRAGGVTVTNETALRHSAVWACLRLRANLISTMPVDVYRRVGEMKVEVPKPPVLVNPGGERVGMMEWLYSTQFDLDRAGNAFGLITARDGLGLPARIDLVPVADVTVLMRKGVLKYRIAGVEFEAREVWHERQYTMAGLHVGLSPIAYAAWSIGEYLSIQQFALDWFGNGAVPSAHLKNTGKTITPGDAEETKRRFKASTANQDVFVTGNDWEYSMIQADAAGADWIEAKRYSVGDIARFFDCPGDLIDAAAGGSMTYANITQRNLQLLVMHLGPAVIRREDALSGLTSRPRFVKLNTDALLRMDPQTRAAMLRTQIESRQLAPSEARELEDRQPFTDSQLAEFDRLFGTQNPAPTAGASAPTGATT
ncbi:phage portal protein [Streptomyces antarcticus]|uniref:phage portal protein n=1 Tax=Streptomyces antarcticus TaxID=2996458 RepID=UPI002270C03E|nr:MULTISPECIES: phage portal protein [unclassified Streptomyces]MCY0943543.1 phage portal protein [Streptomyces sp. H34-AA3]MCZ4083548.1 phage portal protein [Streptomyces sp. H34-S5]